MSDAAQDMFGYEPVLHQSQMAPTENKFHKGNGDDGKHYWLTPPDLYARLNAEFAFDFDPCPFPLPEGFDGLTCEWGSSSYVNPPFGSIIHQGRKKGPTAWVRKSIEEWKKGKRVVLVYPVDKWVLMLLSAIGGDGFNVRNLGDVKWLATEDGSIGKGTGRHIACFILEPPIPQTAKLWKVTPPTCKGISGCLTPYTCAEARRCSHPLDAAPAASRLSHTGVDR